MKINGPKYDALAVYFFVVLIASVALTFWQINYSSNSDSSPPIPIQKVENNQAVLGTSTENTNIFASPLNAIQGFASTTVKTIQNIFAPKSTTVVQEKVFQVENPAVFQEDIKTTKNFETKGTAKFEGDVIVNGEKLDVTKIIELEKITTQIQEASQNILAGKGISITGTTNLTVSNTGVTSLQDKTGALTLTAGDGITIDGLKISNSAQDSDQDLFKSITVNSTSFSAGSTTDTLTFVDGTGISLSADATNKKITISSTVSSSGTGQWSLSSGGLYPNNSTVDLLVGGQATTSALFAVTGVNDGTPVATISASTNNNGLALTGATSTIQSLRNNTLVLGGNTTGDITISPLNGSGTTTNTGTFNLSTGKTYQINATDVLSATTLGSSVVTSSLTTVGALNSGSITTGFGDIDNGTSNITTGGIIKLDVDGTAENAAGSLTLGAGNDAGIFFDGTDLVVITNGAGASGIKLDSEDDTVEILGSGVLQATFDTAGLNLVSGDVYSIAGTSVLSATTLGSGVVTSSLTTVGALSSGSIASGFGTIETANTITGTTINGTTGINTGAGAGTQRIDSSGNLANIGTITSGLINSQTISSSANFTGTVAITTSLTSPVIYGGTGTTSTLTLKPTSGAGTTGSDLIFAVGNNGAVEAMRILDDGRIGIGTNSPAASRLVNIYDNDTDTNAQIRIENAGTGDAAINLAISGVNGWILGADNSLSDNFVISDGSSDLGTNPRFIIENTTGYIGINDTTPTVRLDVNAGYVGYIANFGNTGNADTYQGVQIRACLNTNPTSACNLLELQDGNGTIIGAIEGNGAAGVTLTSGAADYAELFPGNRNDFEEGDIISINSTGEVTKIKKGDNILGVLSTNAIVLGNGVDKWEESTSLVPVGLLGQIVTKVSTENGQINPGDPLTISSKDGRAMKATEPGEIVGRALESFGSGTDPNQEGIILAYVKPGYYLGWNLTSKGSLVTTSKTEPNQDPLFKDRISSTNGSANALYEGQILTTEQIIKLIKEQTEDSSPAESYDNSSATVSAELVSLNTKIDNFRDQIASQETVLASVSALLDKIPIISLTKFSTGSAEFVTVDGELMVLGSTTLGSLAITEDLRVGDSLIVSGNSINTLGQDLEIQSLKQGNISLMGGLVSIDTQGNVAIGGDLKVLGAFSAKSISIDGQNIDVISDTEASAQGSTGQINFKTGTTEFKVNSSLVKNESKIFLTPNSSTNNKQLFIKNIEPESNFIIGIDSPLEADVKVNFLIIN